MTPAQILILFLIGASIAVVSIFIAFAQSMSSMGGSQTDAPLWGFLIGVVLAAIAVGVWLWRWHPVAFIAAALIAGYCLYRLSIWLRTDDDDNSGDGDPLGHPDENIPY